MPGPCHPSNYESSFIQPGRVRVDLRIHPDHPPTRDQLQKVIAAVGLIPEPHLRDFDQRGGYIQFSIRGCTPFVGGGNEPGSNPWIRLSHACLTGDQNSRINTTLLHEMGHIVDTQYDAMTTLRTTNRAAFDLLNSTRHRGATHGPGEKFADCYMIFLVMVKAGLPIRHPAQPAAYRGAAARARFEALLMTPAFRYWTERLPVTLAAAA